MNSSALVGLIILALLICLITFLRLRKNKRKSSRPKISSHNYETSWSRNSSTAVKNLCGHLDQNIIKILKPIYPGDPISRKSGIYCFWVQDGIYENQFFIPIYVGKTNNFQARFRSHYKKIRTVYDEPHSRDFELKYYKICDYLKYHGLAPENIRFSVLEVVENSNDWEVVARKEEYWMHKLASDTRGFNQLHALGFGSHPKEVDENDFFKRRNYYPNKKEI